MLIYLFILVLHWILVWISTWWQITDLKIPLVWKNIFSTSVSSSASLHQHQIYAVFCLIKIKSDVFDTSLVLVDSRLTDDVVFENDVAIFENISHDFEVSLEVYCQVLPSSSTPRDFNGLSDSILYDDVTSTASSKVGSFTGFATPSMPPSSLLTLPSRKESFQSVLTPKRIRDKISHSIGRTFGRKFASSMKNYPSTPSSSTSSFSRSSSTALSSSCTSSLFAVENSG